MKTLLIFGYGYVARYLAEHLRDWRVYATSRTDSHNPYVINFYDHNIKTYIREADAILSTIPPTPSDPVLSTYYNDIEKSKATWIGYLSSTSVYGDHKGNWVQEYSNCQPRYESGIARLRTESQWLTLYSTKSIPIHIFRLSGIYGPERNILRMLRNGRIFTIKKIGHFFSRIHIIDILTALSYSLKTPTPGEIYNISDDEPAPLHTVHQFAAQLLERPLLQELSVEEAPISPRFTQFFRENKRICSKKIKSSLGLSWRFPNYRLGLSDLANLFGKKQHES